MGSHNGRLQVIPYWSRTVAQMLAEPQARITLECGSCKWRREVTKDDLAKTIRNRRYGPSYTCWGQHPKCPECGKPTSYFGQHAPGARMMRFESRDATEEIARLQAQWRADRDRA